MLYEVQGELMGNCYIIMENSKSCLRLERKDEESKVYSGPEAGMCNVFMFTFTWKKVKH